MILNIENLIPNSQPPSFQIYVHSNENIIHIKQKIKDFLVDFQGSLNDLYITTKKNQIHEENKTLSELNISNYQIMYVNYSKVCVLFNNKIYDLF